MKCSHLYLNRKNDKVMQTKLEEATKQAEKAKEQAEKAARQVETVTNQAEKAAALDLAHQLGLFPERVKAAIDGLEPSVIAHYSYDLATAFNRFYQSTRILSAESEDAKAFRLALTKAAGTTLRSALRLICLKTPEKI